MMIRFGVEGWSSWIVYVLVGIMQTTLIAFAIIFHFRDRKKAKDGKDDDVHDPGVFQGWNAHHIGRSRTESQVTRASNVAPDERQPLLAEQRSSGRHIQIQENA